MLLLLPMENIPAILDLAHRFYAFLSRDADGRRVALSADALYEFCHEITFLHHLDKLDVRAVCDKYCENRLDIQLEELGEVFRELYQRDQLTENLQWDFALLNEHDVDLLPWKSVELLFRTHRFQTLHFGDDSSNEVEEMKLNEMVRKEMVEFKQHVDPGGATFEEIRRAVFGGPAELDRYLRLEMEEEENVQQTG